MPLRYRWFDYDFPFALDAHFRSVSRDLAPDEVPLFQALALSFESLASDYAVEVLHGNASQVSYKTTSSWADPSGTERCELCDLMIVSFRRDPFVARVTFLQNKSERRNGSVPPKFTADLVQLELLSRRPMIATVGRFAPPPDLLSGALLPSVGSYGVFYRPIPREYSMAYRVAGELTLPLGGRTARRKVGDLKGPVSIRAIAGHLECVGAPTTLLFASHLAAFRIGTPIHGPDSVGAGEPAGYRARLREWLRASIDVRMRLQNPEYLTSNTDMGTAATLVRLLGGSRDEPTIDAADGPTVVIVETDGRYVLSV